MSSHNHRILWSHNITPAQWAVLFTASYYLPAPPDQFILEVQLESEEDFTEDELADALEECLAHGWISLADSSRIDHLCEEVDPQTVCYREHGIVLTDNGLHRKEQISRHLMEIVEID